MRLQEIMTTDVISIGPDEAADAAWSRMDMNGIRHLLVKDGARLLGVLSERDLGGRNGSVLRSGRTVRELMPPKVVTAKPGTTLRAAANLMRGRLIGCLPIVDDGQVVGIVTATDVLDELGRGSSRPVVQAKRQAMRLPPASAREARRKGARARAARATKKSGKAARARADDDPGARPGGTVVPSRITGRTTPSLGRDRVRQPESPTRAPLPDRLARSDKRVAGRTTAAETPAFIRSVGSTLDDEDRDYLRRKLGRRLGKFARAIERVSVRVEDVNGPRGGVDKRCRIKVVLSGLPSVLVEEHDHSLQAAMDRALARAERSVRSAVQRRRMKPMTRGDGGARNRVLSPASSL